MLQHFMPSDLHYSDVADTTVLQGSFQWGSGHPDPSQPAVNTDLDDCQRTQQQCTPINYTPATAYTLHDPYPAHICKKSRSFSTS
jgi:hypothetical protein